MRTANWVKRCAFAGAVAAAVGAASPSQAASNCSTLNVTFNRVLAVPLSLGPYNLTLDSGDVVVLRDTSTSAGTATDTLSVGSNSSSFNIAGTTSITVGTSGAYSVSVTGTAIPIPGVAGVVTLTCTPGPGGGADSQLRNNAQIAVSNGLRTIQNYQEWVTKGVLGSFGMTRGGDTASIRPAVHEASSLRKAEALAREERDLNEELAVLPPGDERRAEIKDNLVTVRRRLAFARVSADLAAPDGSSRRLSPSTGTAGDKLDEFAVREAPSARAAIAQPLPDSSRTTAQAAAAPPSLSLEACDLWTCDAADPLNRKWNVWAEGRVAGLNDSLAQTNTLGFAGAGGVDYKFLPWLAVGMSVGVETYETRFGVPGVRTGTIGVSLVPYFGIRLHENIYAEGFVGLTKLNYNLTPAVNVSGGFDAWRVFLGGALSGVWHDGGWRFQPSIMGAWGSETQNAYTDSANTAVPGQTITFGRIAAGPEIGYTFKDMSRGWTFEPFAVLKGNIDFSSAPIYSIAGTPVVVRSGAQGSGQAGGGLAMQLDDGFYLRVQASYDSLFVSGLDAWSGRIRAGKTF